MDAGSAAALYAGSIVLRKTFEAVAQRSLSSIFSSLHARFRGQDQLQTLQRELESRLQVLSLPVDMCIQHVLHGNTALQGALDMVILLINDIVSFQEELEAQAYNESVPKLSQNEAAKRLEGFLSRLDAILPYLALAVNAVSLLRTAHPDLSPSRLMEASHLIRCAGGKQGVVMNIIVKLHKFETRLTLPRWQEKMLTCHALLRQSANSLVNRLHEFELVIINGKPLQADGEVPLCFPVDNIAAIGSSTVHVLGLGDHNLEGVLLLDLMDNSNKLLHFALQCIEDDTGTPCHDFETKSNDGNSSEDDGNSSEDDGNANEGAQKVTPSVGSTSRISKLGLLEYALRLCMLESREERDHWDISDERIRMFFGDPRYVSEPVANVQKTSGSKGADIIRLTPNQKKKLSSDPTMQTPPANTTSGTSRQASRRLSITEMFYDLQVDSPAKLGKDGSKS